jgi:signal transduction histidine kinase
VQAPAPESLLRLGHELRTPLTALIGYAEAMEHEIFGALPAPYPDHAATIVKAARQVLALVDDMTADGGWRPRRERIDAAALARDALTLFAPRAVAARVALRSNIPTQGLMITADRRAMCQILNNLLDNALNFTAADGEVTLTLDDERGELRLRLWDSGGGEAPPGQGLGLEIVREICDAHGGRFELAATPRGSVATVWLPLGEPA